MSGIRSYSDETGAGKSTLLSLLMAQATKYPDVNIVCIDKQLSSRAFMVAGGGIYIEPGKDAVAFQPLSELKNPDECTAEEFAESLLWCQQFIEGLLAQQNIECTPAMGKVITETLRLVSQKPTKDLSTFQSSTPRHIKTRELVRTRCNWESSLIARAGSSEAYSMLARRTSICQSL